MIGRESNAAKAESADTSEELGELGELEELEELEELGRLGRLGRLVVLGSLLKLVLSRSVGKIVPAFSLLILTSSRADICSSAMEPSGSRLCDTCSVLT
jgi:hypothetical protein